MTLQLPFFRFYDYYVIQLSTRLKEFVFRLLFFGRWHFRLRAVDSLTRMDLMQFSTVVALANTSIISISALELWKLSNSVSEASFTLKMMRWHQPTGPPAPLNYWRGEIECIIHHSFYKYNHLYTIRWKLIFVAYCTVYCSVYRTVYCIVYCSVHCTTYCTVYSTSYRMVYYIVYCNAYRTVYCESDIICVCHRTAEQILLELKLAKGFSSNIQGDGPLMSEIRYIRRKYTPKRRRFSPKLLKREAETALDEPSLKRQRIFNIVKNSNVEQVRGAKRTLNYRTSPPSKFCRFARQLQLLFKRAAPECFDNPSAKILRISILRNSQRARILSSIINFAFSFVPPPLIKRRRRIFIEPTPIPDTSNSSIRENELLIVTLSPTPALVNNRKKSKKEQLKEGIFPKTID